MIRSVQRRAAGLALACCLGLAAFQPAALSAQEGVRVVGDSVFLNFRDLPLATAMESISRVLGINYVLSGDVAGALTIHTRRGIPRADVPRVLEIALTSQGLAIQEAGGLYIISRRQTPGAGQGEQEGAPARDIFVFFLEHAEAVDMANMLVSLFGGETRRYEREGPLEETGSLSEELRRMRLPPGTGEVLRPERIALPEALPSRAAATGELIGGLTVVPNERTNALVVRTAPENYEPLRNTIARLDVRPQQVMIEVVIAEVSLDDRSQFGIDFLTFFGGGGTEGEVSSLATPGGLEADSSGFRISIFDPGTVELVLRALASDNRLNVLSTPRILASNNEEARILIGSEVPFVQVSSFGGIGNNVVQSVQFRNVGLELTVVPRINQNREVALDIRQENSTLSAVTFGNLDAPVINTRELESSLIVGDGRTVVLGGLIDSQLQTQRSGIPLLMDIPLLGRLFESTEDVVQKRELIITLTPRVVRTDDEIERLRRDLQGEDQFLEQGLERLRREVPPDTVPLGGGGGADTTAGGSDAGTH